MRVTIGAADASVLQARSGIEQLSGLVGGKLERVNALILDKAGSDVALIPEVASHLISSGGKRIRPMLTLAMADLFGYRGDGDVKLATAVEFMHTATLLHDDVVDESAMRRGRPAARMIWGNQASVLVGDFLLGQAFKLMVEAGSLPALRVFSDAAATISEGEVLQLSGVGKIDIGEAHYMAVIHAKTAALFAAATAAGPIIAGAPPAMEAHAAAFGLNLGIAFQLIDDVLDFVGDLDVLGKNVGDDLREGKATLPVLFAYERGGEADRSFWRRAIESRELTDDDVLRAVQLVRETGALEEARRRALGFGDAALDALGAMPASATRSILADVVTFTLDRAS